MLKFDLGFLKQVASSPFQFLEEQSQEMLLFHWGFGSWLVLLCFSMHIFHSCLKQTKQWRMKYHFCLFTCFAFVLTFMPYLWLLASCGCRAFLASVIPGLVRDRAILVLRRLGRVNLHSSCPNNCVPREGQMMIVIFMFNPCHATGFAAFKCARNFHPAMVNALSS